MSDVIIIGNKIHVHTAITDGCGNIDPAYSNAYDQYLSIGILNHTHNFIKKLRLMNDTVHPQWREFSR